MDDVLPCVAPRGGRKLRRRARALRADQRVGERPFPVAYQVTIALGDTKQEALAEREYIDAYYPGFSDAVALADWGPTGTADEVIDWFDRSQPRGVTAFVCLPHSINRASSSEWHGT